ncbi:hypothetical protein Mal65_53430 [Crateriforma conspicua]|nr:hypothetical protein Mal65_53430 [Crateriforma conspicua]
MVVAITRKKRLWQIYHKRSPQPQIPPVTSTTARSLSRRTFGRHHDRRSFPLGFDSESTMVESVTTTDHPHRSFPRRPSSPRSWTRSHHDHRTHRSLPPDSHVWGSKSGSKSPRPPDPPVASTPAAIDAAIPGGLTAVCTLLDSTIGESRFRESGIPESVRTVQAGQSPPGESNLLDCTMVQSARSRPRATPPRGTPQSRSRPPLVLRRTVRPRSNREGLGDG